MAELKLVVGADVKPAEQALKGFVNDVSKATSNIGGFANESAKAASTFNNLGSAFSKSSSQITSSSQAVVKAVKEIDLTVETLRAKIAARKDFILTEKDLSKIAQYNKEIESLESVLRQVENTGKSGFWNGAPLDRLSEKTIKAGSALSRLPVGTRQANTALLNLGRIAQDAPFGFIAIQNNLTELLPSFQRLRQEAGSTGGALKTFFRSLAGVGGIGLGISVLTSVFTILSLRSRDAKDDTDKLSKSLNEAEEAQKRLSQAADKAAGSVVNQAKDIQNLRDIILSTSAATNQLADSTIRQGLARLIFDEKNAELQKILSAEIQKQLILRKRTVGVGGLGKFVDDKETESLRKFNETLASTGNLDVNLNKDVKQLDKLNDSIFSAGGNLNFLTELGADLTGFFKTFLDGAGKSGETTEQFINRAKQLAAELEKIGRIQPEFSFFDTQEEQLQKARKVFSDFANKIVKLNPNFFKIEPTLSAPPPEKVREFLNTVDEGIQKGMFERGGIQLETSFSLTTDFSQNDQLIRDFQTIFANIGKAMPDIDMNAPAGFNRNVIVDSLRRFFKAGQEVTEEELANMANQFNQGIQRINGIIQNFAVDGTASFAESLGAALSGGDVVNVFKNFAAVVGDALTAIGKQMIALSPVIAALKAALKTLNPALLLPAGVALVAIGAALKSTVGKGITGFAQGGLVFGPTLGLVGEGIGTSRSNPEVIAPLDQLRGMLADLVGGNQGGPVVLTTRLRGRDLALVQARTNRRQRRIGG